MDVIAWSQNLTEERAREAGVRLVSREALFAEADYLSLHLVLGDRSRGLVGAADLARMKPTAYLINTSRRPIVQEDALLDALRNRHIAGAGLDVYDVEPYPSSIRCWRSTTSCSRHTSASSRTTPTPGSRRYGRERRSFLKGPTRVLNP